jgi:group II intron reverse transcriptase/maturase
MPQACADGPFKGYIGLDWISSAAKKLDEGARMTTLMHHLHIENLRQAFRQCNGNKAVGIDQITKSQYGRELQSNLEQLSEKLTRGGWRPKPSRQVLIPKPQGGTRPLAVGCLEDKIVQTVTAKILEAIYEPIMHRHSYGFRSGRSTHQALSRLYSEINKRGKHAVVVEMDIEKFFDSMDQKLLMQMLEKKIQDPFFLRHIQRVLRNSILMPSGENLVNEMGTPQGNPASPVLANIYLHYALDEWFETHWQKWGEIIRYADDAVFVFSSNEKAQEFRLALEARLAEFKLKLNAEKSGIRSFGPKDQAGDLPFVGFALYWGKAWHGKRYLKAKTHPKRLSRCIQSFKEWIKANRHRYKLDVLWEKAKAKIIGHYNYYGVSTNLSKLNHFYFTCISLLFKWLNRRSQRRSFTWDRFMRRLMFNPIPKPTIGAIVIDLNSGLGTELKRKPRSRMRKSRTYGSQRSRGQQCPLFT